MIDEVHLVGEQSRGFLLELLCTKALQFSHIQIIGMSATIPNLDQLGNWLTAKVYRTDYRPVPLKVNLCLKTNFYTVDSQNRLKFDGKLPAIPEVERIIPEGEQRAILSILLKTFEQKNQVMIFCPTKAWCETMARKLAEQFKNLGPDILPVLPVSEIESILSESGIYHNSPLYNLVKSNVCYHHAGLTTEERRIG